MDGGELRKKLLDNRSTLKIKFKRNLIAGKYSDPDIHGVSVNEEALLVDVSYGERTSFNYPARVVVLDVIVTRLSKRQVHYIEEGMGFVSTRDMERQCNVELVFPDSVNFHDALKIL